MTKPSETQTLLLQCCGDLLCGAHDFDSELLKENNSLGDSSVLHRGDEEVLSHTVFLFNRNLLD